MSGVQLKEVGPAEEGWRLDKWVRTHFPQLSHTALQKLLRTGQFRVDGKRIAAGLRLAPGQTVRVPPLPAAPPPGERPPVRAEDARLVRELVLHEDDSLIVLAKPAGIAVQGGTGTTRHLDGMLAALARGGERPRLVHRLDRDTSGVLLLARDGRVAKRLMHAFQQHEVRKLYWAILARGPMRDEGRIDLPLAKTGGAGAEKVEVDPQDGGRFAQTAFRVLARAGKVAAFTALLPLTGRTHQLRAHCAAIDAPILGDFKYGGAAAAMNGVPAGLMLHARELELRHPATGRLVRYSAEPPSAFLDGLRWLGLPTGPQPGGKIQDWPAQAVRAGAG